MVRIPTVSSRKEEEVDEKAFEDFRNLLEELYPHVTASAHGKESEKAGSCIIGKEKIRGIPLC